MMMRVAAVALFALLGGLAQARADVDEIGTVEQIRTALYGTLAGSSDAERLFKNDQVFADETIATVRKSSAQIRFIDDTNLWLGESSQVVLDTFVFDPSTGTGQMVAELGVGLFRFVTGNLPNDGVEIITPVATIGVRGTDFSVAVAEDGSTEVTVYAGMVTVSPLAGGGAQSVGAGETAAVGPGGSGVSVSAGRSSPPASVASGGGDSGAANAGGGGSCFTGETRVVMADGQLKAIQDITVGEAVLGRNGAFNVVTGVKRIRLDGRMLYGFDSGTPFVTAEHPFMTTDGWKSINPAATAEENPSLRVGRLERGDLLAVIEQSAWRLAAFGDPRGTIDGALHYEVLTSMTPTAADAGTVVHNLLVDGNHTYWVVQSDAAPLAQTISVTPAAPRSAYLVHNKGQ
jgi:hypothetical protein